VAEQAGCPPEKFFAGFVLEFLEFFDDAVEILVGFCESGSLGGDVTVVEAVVVDLAFLKELKEDGYAVERVLQGLRTIVPGHQGSACAEGVAEFVAHDVPVGGAEAEVVTHGFAANYFIGIVMAEGEGVGRALALVLEGRDVREVFGHGVVWFVVLGS